MPLLADPVLLWCLFAIQIVGLVSMVLARMPHLYAAACILPHLLSGVSGRRGPRDAGDRIVAHARTGPGAGRSSRSWPSARPRISAPPLRRQGF